MNDRFVNGIRIYSLDNDTLSKATLDKIAKSKFADFKQLDSVPKSSTINLYSIIIQKPSKDFTPPDTNSLSYFARGLSHGEKSNLQKYNNVVSIVFQGQSKNVYDKQRRIYEFVNELVKDKNVVVADFNSYEWFNPKSWNERRVNKFTDSIKNIAHQISVHLYRDGEFCRAVTMGMDKFCLPDISIKAFACSDQKTYNNLINAAIQTLAENPYMFEDSTLTIDLKSIKNDVIRNELRTNLKQNAKESATITLKSIKPEKGNNFNKQFLISFQDPSYTSPQEEQDNVAANLFGAEDSIVRITHDSLLLKTSEKTRQRLPELKTLFNKGLAPEYSVLVKAPFKIENGGNEWMWIEITKWTSKSITGVLQNDPIEIKNLKAGAIVQVLEKDIFDYILNKPDGSSEGNETGKLMEGKE
ncbi:MAG: hypothetical protein JWN56_1114 [Sphingobacteriales bacterium]|nr:hypothetical protein [Sphingobacteriales bacterium]